VPRQAKPEVPSQSAPAWQDPAGWALWRLSFVLREIADSLASDAEKEKLPRQAPTQDNALTGGSEESNPHDQAPRTAIR
jgi:hypothetical protein